MEWVLAPSEYRELGDVCVLCFGIHSLLLVARFRYNYYVIMDHEMKW